MSSTGITLSIVDDYEVVVAGVARMLEPFAGRVDIVELEAGSLPTQPVDIVLYDTFAAKHGSDVDYREILRSSSAGKLVVYCWNMRPELVDGALAQGASGYLSKRLEAAELVAALERVVAGEVVVAGNYDEIVEWTVGDWPGKSEGLTEREAETLAWIARGVSNEEVAKRVFLSVNTIKSHIRTAYRKMGVETRAQAVLWAVDHGFSQVKPPGSGGDDF